MSAVIKVAEVLFSLDIERFGGGAERFAIALSKQLDRSIFDIYVIGIWSVGTQSEKMHFQELTRMGINVFILSKLDVKHPYYSFLESILKLCNIVTQHRIDILHSHSQFADIAVFLMKIFGKIKIIVRTVHDGYPVEWRKRPLRRFLLTNLFYPIVFNAEIGVANHIVDRLNSRFIARFLHRKALYICNAIDLSRFQSVDKYPELRVEDAFVVGSIGRLTEGKGYEVLLEAAQLVLKKMPRVKFIIIGEGDAINVLKKKSVDLGIERQVIFTGARIDVEHLLRQMDVFVLPSFWEGLSTAILESMASGIPIIATNIPGNREIIEDLVNGLLVPPGDALQLADAILTALQNRDLRIKLSQNALDTVKHFSIQRVATQHQRLYYELIKKHKY